MNRIITGKHIELGESLKNQLEKTFDSFYKYNLDFFSERVIITENKKKEFQVEFILKLKQKRTVIVEASDKDVYEAVGIAAQKAEKALRRLADKIKDPRKNTSLKDLQPEDLEIVDSITMEEKVENLVIKQKKLEKFMTIEDAISELESNENRIFFVFNDEAGISRTIYKRKDGNIGIY